ncbi:hypothetical protein SEUCBS140593_009178 [Sporothrix eucalyptigena]|uniref:Uncharacterized protein n=1 Tax=Sporothrix eucalyptigena TaxID=1812306 RepID=A0ABP0CTJ8_9PEZI
MRSNNPCAYDLDKLNDALAEVDGYHSNLSQSAYFGCFDKVDQEFLLHYGDTIASAAAVIRTKEEHVARLRKTCRQMSILPEDNPKEDDDTGEDYELQQDDLDIFSAKASSFPILLSNPLYAVKQYPLTIRAAAQKMLALPKNEPERQALIDDSVKEYGILISLMRSAEGSKSDFINRWILQQLRMSPMAAVQFYSIFSGVLPIVDVIRWQQDVLCFWTRDGTNEPDGPITGHSSSCSGVFALSVVSENDDEG